MSNDREKIAKRRQKRRKRRMKASFKLFLFCVILVCAGGGYLGYLKYQASHTPDTYGKLSEVDPTQDGGYDLSDEAKPEARYWVINAGSGESIYIKCGSVDILIDTGSASDGKAIIDTVSESITDGLDYLLITSTSPRRIGGLESVCKALSPAKVITCPLGDEQSEIWSDIGKGIEREEGKEQIIQLPNNGSLTIFLPEVSSKDPYDQSLMTYFRYGETGFFAESDAGDEEEAKVVSKIQICNAAVPSRAGSDEVNKLIDDVKADILIVPTSKETGLPSEKFVERVSADVYATYDIGTIKFATDGKFVTSNIEKERKLTEED